MAQAITCGNNVNDLFHLLAKAVVKDSNGVNYLRVNLNSHACAAIESAIDCSNAVTSPEELLKSIFYTDCDGILTINVSYAAPVPE